MCKRFWFVDEDFEGKEERSMLCGMRSVVA